MMQIQKQNFQEKSIQNQILQPIPQKEELHIEEIMTSCVVIFFIFGILRIIKGVKKTPKDLRGEKLDEVFNKIGAWCALKLKQMIKGVKK